MQNIRTAWEQHRPTLVAALTALVCVAALFAVWLTEVRPNLTKAQSVKVNDVYDTVSEPLEDGASAVQTFALDDDLLAMAFVFAIPGEQPTGTLDLTLTDADTGEVLATSTGEMGNILPDQYTGLGLDRAVPGVTGRHYAVTLTPHYTGAGRLALCHAQGATLWEESLTIAGQPVDGTLALLVTTQRIGGFLTRFFLIVGLLACGLVFWGIRAALRHKLSLHRMVFVLVLGFGLLYSAVLPPYAAPDEKYHINQSFTLACRWANMASGGSWWHNATPLDTTFRRPHDANALLQDERTTVFTWEECVDGLFTVTEDHYNDFVELQELQTDTNPLLYLPSAAMVLLCFVLRLGFVPTLMLGRLANLLVFAALAALAVRRAPFGRRLFAAAALLPMTLHLAASFSRDALLLGLCFAFTALCCDAIFRERPAGQDKLTLSELLPLAVTGILLAPGKVVYLPLAALALLIPARRLGTRPWLKKGAYLVACGALALLLNGGMLQGVLQTDAATATAEPVAAEAVPLAASPSQENTIVPLAAAQPLMLEGPLQERTPEAFVRRLYALAEGNDAPLEREVAYWVQALNEGDTTAALLGQSFFFSPAELEHSALTDAEFVQAVGYCYLGRDPLQGSDEGAYFLNMIAEHDRVYLFKALYVSEEAAQYWAEAGFEMGGYEPEYYPLDRALLVEWVDAARATRASQSVVSEEDSETYSPLYLLTHPVETVLLVVRSVLRNGDHYLRTLVGGSLSYYTLDLSWCWVAVLYLLLCWAALPAAGETSLLPQGRYRVGAAFAALACCALAVAGCLVWTPVHYDTIYGLQGRYFLPVLPLLLLTCWPRKAAQVVDEDTSTAQLLCALCMVQFGVVVNIMLAVIAR